MYSVKFRIFKFKNGRNTFLNAKIGLSRLFKSRKDFWESLPNRVHTHICHYNLSSRFCQVFLSFYPPLSTRF